MVVRRTNGFHPLYQLRNEVDRLMSGYFGGAPMATAAREFPPLNIWEAGDDLFAEAELPGVKPEDVDVSVVGSDLTIRGHRDALAQEGMSYHRQERSAGEFTRVVRLPFEVDDSKVEASLQDGVLLIKLPRAESAKPKKIKVPTPSGS